MALEAIRWFCAGHDNIPPTLAELSGKIGCTQATALRLLAKLEEQKRIKRHPGMSRGIVVLEEANR